VFDSPSLAWQNGISSKSMLIRRNRQEEEHGFAGGHSRGVSGNAVKVAMLSQASDIPSEEEAQEPITGEFLYGKRTLPVFCTTGFEGT
jgi:hypothetical protein